MKHLSLHFDSQQLPDRPLTDGVHRLVREPAGTLAVGERARGDLLAEFRLDKRGLWLHVAGGAGVHVNGRPVRRIALLRAGDTVHAHGSEIEVRSAPASAPAKAKAGAADPADPCIVLRGVGGAHHGRSYTLSRTRRIGSASDSDIRVDVPGAPVQLAELQPAGACVRLHAMGTLRQVRVNGTAVQEAWLMAGDQIAFDPQSRFVVEVPWSEPAEPTNAAPPAGIEPMPEQAGSTTRWPWLLLAALLLAGALAALLLFGG